MLKAAGREQEIIATTGEATPQRWWVGNVDRHTGRKIVGAPSNGMRLCGEALDAGRMHGNPVKQMDDIT